MKRVTTNKLASIEQIAQLLKVDIFQVEEFVRKHSLPRERKNQFDLSRVIHWKIEYDRRQLEAAQRQRYEWTAPELADLFGVNIRTIDKAAKESGMPRKGRGIFDVRDAIKWRLNQYKKQIEILQAGGEDALQSKRRTASYVAEIKRMDMAERMGQIIAIEELTPVLQDAITLLVQKSEVLPDRAAVAVARLETYEERKAAIKKIKDEVFDDLSTVPDTLRRLAESHRKAHAGVGPVEAAPADDRKRTRKRQKVDKRVKRSK